MSRYEAILDEADRAVRMMNVMVLELQRASLAAAGHKLFQRCSEDPAELVRHRRAARDLEGEARRRLHDLAATAERMATLLEETFGLD